MFDIGTKMNTLNRKHYGCRALEQPVINLSLGPHN